MTLGDLRARLAELDELSDNAIVLMSKDSSDWYYKSLKEIKAFYNEPLKEIFVVLIPDGSL